jgi:hypothetical protein
VLRRVVRHHLGHPRDRRLGDYQGVWGLGYQIEPVIFPALYTFLALEWGAPGWAGDRSNRVPRQRDLVPRGAGR